MTRTLSPESAKELAELKYLWSLGDSEALRYDAEKKSYRWWTPNDTSYHSDPEVIDERNVPSVSTDSKNTLQIREQMDEDLLAWTLRDKDEIKVAEFEPTDDEKAQRIEERAAWEVSQIRFLRAKLHRLLKVYFDKADYVHEDLVTRYVKIDGRFYPDEYTPIIHWIRTRVKERGELSGYASLVRSIEYRLAKRRSRAGQSEAAWVKAA